MSETSDYENKDSDNKSQNNAKNTWNFSRCALAKIFLECRNHIRLKQYFLFGSSDKFPTCWKVILVNGLFRTMVYPSCKRLCNTLYVSILYTTTEAF